MTHVYWLEEIYHEAERIDAMISVMFQGDARRNGRESPHHEYYFLRSPKRHPLEIHREGTWIPDVTMPAENLVVAENLMWKLRALPNVDFYQVHFAKLFRYPWRIGEFSHWDDARFTKYETGEWPWEFFDQLKDVPEFHRRAGRYYELLLPMPPYLRRKYRGIAKKYVVGEGDDADDAAWLCPRMIDENPIVRFGGRYFLSERCSQILHPHLDKDFFRVGSLDI